MEVEKAVLNDINGLPGKKGSLERDAYILEAQTGVESALKTIVRLIATNSVKLDYSATVLRQWPTVARGERANIFPHQNEADMCFNSSLP